MDCVSPDSRSGRLRSFAKAHSSPACRWSCTLRLLRFRIARWVRWWTLVGIRYCLLGNRLPRNLAIGAFLPPDAAHLLHLCLRSSLWCVHAPEFQSFVLIFLAHSLCLGGCFPILPRGICPTYGSTRRCRSSTLAGNRWRVSALSVPSADVRAWGIRACRIMLFPLRKWMRGLHVLYIACLYSSFVVYSFSSGTTESRRGNPSLRAMRVAFCTFDCAMSYV